MAIQVQRDGRTQRVQDRMEQGGPGLWAHQQLLMRSFDDSFLLVEGHYGCRLQRI